MKNIPVPKKTIKTMQELELYPRMLERYGESILHNHLEVEFILLTEEEDVITASGEIIHITRDLIEEVYHATKTHWLDYLKNPVNMVKSWFNPTGEGIGYITIQSNHTEDSTAENEFGWLLGNSLKIDIIGNKMILRCKGMLVSPYAKWKYIEGTFRKVSPTFAKSTKRIIETSFVPTNAQVTNTSLASGEILAKSKQLEANLAKTEKKLKDKNKQKYKIKQSIKESSKQLQEQKVNAVVDNLFYNNVISSGQMKPLKEQLLSLGSGDMAANLANVVNTIQSNSCFSSKPKVIFLKGQPMSLNQTDEQLYVEFKESARNAYGTEQEFHQAFHAHLANIRSQEKISLSTGDITDPKDNLMKAIKLANEANVTADPDLQKQIAEALNISLSSGEGSTQAAGCVESANNTQLSDGEKERIAKKAAKKVAKKAAKKAAKKMAKESEKPMSEDKPHENISEAKTETKPGGEE